MTTCIVNDFAALGQRLAELKAEKEAVLATPEQKPYIASGEYTYTGADSGDTQPSIWTLGSFTGPYI